MNAANLQLQGLMMAVAAVNQSLVAKGVITTEALERTLAITEQTALGQDHAMEDLSPANRDALVFPIRLLRMANRMAGSDEMPSFSELTRLVGETKGPHNDQM